MQEPKKADLWTRLANRMDRRLVKTLDRATIGSERVFIDGPNSSRSGFETMRLYEMHGWVQVGNVTYHPGSKSNGFTYRKVRQADPAEVAELHRNLGYQPKS